MSIKTKVLAGFMFLFFLVNLYLPANQGEPGTLKIFGTIKDAEGKPLAGVEVKVISYAGVQEKDRERETKSGNRGKYAIEGVPENSTYVAILVSHPDFISSRKSFRPESYETGEIACDFVLKKGGTISGTITSASGPVKDARISTRSKERTLGVQFTKSDAKGHYSLNVESGEHTLTADHKDFKPEKKEVAVKVGEKIVLDISFKKGISISGKVVDKKDQPVEGADVSAFIREGYSATTRRTRTDSKGNFVLQGLKEGKVSIGVYHKNYTVKRETAAAGTTGLKIVLDAGMKIKGRVIAADNSKPIEDFTIYAAPSDGIYQINYPKKIKISPGGKFTCKDSVDPDRKYHIIVSAPGYSYTLLEKIDLTKLPAGLEVKLSPGKTLKGLVLSKDNKPVAGARIREIMKEFPELQRYNLDRFAFLKNAKTGKAGEFVLENVFPGGIKLSISHPGYQAFEQEAVPRGADAAVTFRLSPGFSISGQVSRSNKKAAGLKIMVYLKKRDRFYRPKSTSTDGAGKYVLEHLAAGPYGVYVSEGEGMNQSMLRYADVDIVDQDIKLDFKPLGDRRVFGTVYLDGKPVKGAAIMVSTAGDKKDKKRLCSVISGAGGRYEVIDLPAVPVVLDASKRDMSRTQRIYASDTVDLAKLKETQHKIILKKEMRVVLKTGEQAPVFSAKKLDGKTLRLADLRGKIVIMDFWATWCGPCIKEIPNIKKLYEKYKSKGLEIIGISLDTDRKALEDYIEKEKLLYPQLFDGKGWETGLTKTYGVWAVPSTFLIDKKGIIRAVNLRGEELEKEVKKLIR